MSMVTLKNDTICPETEIRVLLSAGDIPDGARVTKRNGDVRYTLRHRLKIYGSHDIHSENRPIIIDGTFLISDTGDVNQVTPGKKLMMITTAEEFVDSLVHSWTERTLEYGES